MNVTYGFIGGTWLYFTILVLTHMLGIYGWTFDSHDPSDIRGWASFVMIPFLLPLLLQAWCYLQINPAGNFNGVFGMVRRGDPVVVVDSKDEMVIIENDKKGQETSSKNSRAVALMDSAICLASNLYLCCVISLIMAVISTKLFLSSETDELLSKLFICLVCVTWINCSVAPLLLLAGESEIEQSRAYVDAVVRAVLKSVLSYLKLYTPSSCGGVVTRVLVGINGVSVVKGSKDKEEDKEEVGVEEKENADQLENTDSPKSC